MALLKSKLKGNINSIFKSGSNGSGAESSKNAFVDDFVSAYISYASKAADLVGNAVLALDAKKPVVVSGIVSGLTKDNSLMDTSNLIFNNLTILWGGVMLEMLKIPPGWVSIITNTITTPGIPATGSNYLVSNLKNTDKSIDAAGIWAEALDTYTKTVGFTTTGLMPGPTSPIPAPPITGVIK